MNDMEKTQVSESEDFAARLEETMVKFRPGQVVKGVVAQVSDDGVVVSIPGKADGFIKKNDLVTTDCKVDDEAAPHNGDCILCHLQHEKSENYCAQCHNFKFVVP